MFEIDWLTVLIGVLLTVVFTSAVRYIAVQRNWMDRPGPDRIHTVPVPRLGGLAMYAAFVATVLIVRWPLSGHVIGL